MKEIIELFNTALTLFKELTTKLDSMKKESDLELEQEIKNKVIAINGIPYLNIPKYVDDKKFIPTFDDNITTVTESNFNAVDLPEISELCDSCETIVQSNFEPLNPQTDDCCETEPIINNDYTFKHFNEPILIEDGNLGEIENDCVIKAKK